MSIKSENQNVNKKHLIFTVISAVLAVIANAIVLVALNIIQRYNGFSQFLFIAINVVAVLLLMIVNLLVVMQTRSKKNVPAIFVVILSVVLTGIS